MNGIADEPDYPRVEENSVSMVASRRVLHEADAFFERTGTEHRGFLSEDHGFLPRRPTPMSLPSSHRAWDEIAAALPSLWRDVAVRPAVEELPLLHATADHLSDDAVRRAAVILGTLAHSYVRSDLAPNGELPPSLAQPWEEVAGRLGRPEAFLQFEDLFLANWTQVDAAGPLEIENLDILVAFLRTPVETNFNLAMIEMHARATPVVGAVVRAQEAAAARDRDALEAELTRLIDVVVEVTEQSFLRIDPNPYSRRRVDPVLWGALVAPFPVSLKPHIPGPGGTASPIFHVIDSFLGRRDFASLFGHEAIRLREYGPATLGEFVVAVAEASLRDSILVSGDRRLRGLMQTLVDVYAGRRGLIAMHRRKAYGYLEVAFKVGRPVTIGGVGGTFHDRPWVSVHHELELTREERSPELPIHPHLVTLQRRGPTDPGASPDVAHLSLDITDRGLPYRPGDRLGVLPENDGPRVAATLVALRATGEEPIPLTGVWREALRYRGYDEVETLPARDLLRCAKLRPLQRPTAKALQAVSDSRRLHSIVETRTEDQWELADALELAAADGYDVTRLLTAQVWQDESLAALVPPEPFRIYSISSPPDRDEGGLPTTLDLTVGVLRYETGEGGPEPVVTRRGTASTFLTGTAPTTLDALSVRIVHPTRFKLPADPTVPIVMLAGGTGISPFRGFAHARSRQAAGATHLFLSVPTSDRLYYRRELEQLVASGALHVHVALSREDAEVRLDPTGQRFDVVPGERRRIDALMETDENARLLWDLLRPVEEGGGGGVAYICGQGGFAQTVLSSLYRIAERFQHEQPRQQLAAQFVRELMADQRLMLDVFTTFAPAAGEGALGSGSYDASEVALHNGDEHGYWSVIDGNVHDMTEFRHLHPGGRNIVDSSAGMDATREYRIVGHHEDPEIDAMLSMYKIGRIRRLDFGRAWGIALSSEGLRYVSLHDAFRSWVRTLYLVVEMQNALRSDLQYLTVPITRGDDSGVLTPQKLMMFGNTHHRFSELYYGGLLGSPLHDLWATTVGLCAPDVDATWMRDELERLDGSPAADEVRRIGDEVRGLYRGSRRRDAAWWERAARLLAAVEENDRGFLRAMKLTLRLGVALFERHQSATIERAASELVAVLRSVPDVVTTYQRELAAGFGAVAGVAAATDGDDTSGPRRG